MRHLKAFLEVARLKSVTRAAEALNTVQPSVSRTLGELETVVGQSLFVRTNRGVALTRAGETFYRHVESGMLQIAHGVDRVKGQGKQNSITIGILPNMARRHAPLVVARFKDLRPDVNVIIETRYYVDVLDRVRNGIVDFIVGRMLSPNKLQGMHFERLYSEPIVFVARASHKLCGAKDLKPKDLDAFTVLFPLDDTILRFELDKFLIRHEMRGFSNRIETVSYEFVRAYLRENDAIGCLPIGIVRRELDNGDFTRLDVPCEDLEGHVGITSQQGRELSEATQLMIDLFRAQCA